MLIHGTAIAMGQRAIVLTGPTQSGKSELAWRTINEGAALIADDLVTLVAETGKLIATRQPDREPLLAVRSIGIILAARAVDRADLSLCVRLDPHANGSSLLPTLGKVGPWYGLCVPEITLHPFEASATAKLALALERYGL
jgi:HPr kinase/phosphorylase